MKKKSAYYQRGSSASPIGALFLLVLIGLIGFFGWRLLPEIIKAQFGQFDRFNLAVAGKQVMLVSLNPGDKSLAVVRLPDDLYVTNVVHGYGQYKISSVYSVGELDRRGGETIAGTMREYLGLPVDAFYVVDQNFTDPKSFFFSTNFLFKANTNMTLVDKIRFLLNVINVRFDKINITDLSQNAGSLVLADGSNALTLDPAEVDRVLQGIFAENQIQAENFRVEVVNSTKTIGLGARAVRLLTNIGLSVINVESNDETLDSCQILATEKALKSLTVKRIADIYDCNITKKPTEDRAAITVKLGQKYANFLTQ